ncbi:SRPBCC domain-containing protein [Streptomyces sp. TLI_171]|uniref:ArsR/SmtB family transcription factor n=1 Tax=Streptomyces sp. TLI_171 TaxID=1938859 RepID=UPI000C197A93|nr:SRPBCC domain-containing protein [Streptomyces sp. TLI_171]
MDAVFKALADPTRRRLLDRLRLRDGQTLRELCEEAAMARQSVTQHVDLLVAAHLVTVVRRGRERLHYLNPAPIHEIEQRWIADFDRPRLDALGAIKRQAEQEHAMSTAPGTVPTYVYVTYIRATPEQVWKALTDADLTARYWGHANVSDWQPGSRWEHRRTDGSGRSDVTGRVLAAEPPSRLVITFEDRPDLAGQEDAATVTFLVEPHEEIVRLTVTHEKLRDLTALNAISQGWPAVLANLKSLLETGETLPQAPWEMAPTES